MKGPTRGGDYSTYYTYEIGETEGAAAIAALNGRPFPSDFMKLEVARLDARFN